MFMESVCLSLDTEMVSYDHYLRLGGALNFEFSLKKRKYIYTTGWAIKTIYKQQGVFIKSNTPEQPFKSEP